MLKHYSGIIKIIVLAIGGIEKVLVTEEEIEIVLVIKGEIETVLITTRVVITVLATKREGETVLVTNGEIEGAIEIASVVVTGADSGNHLMARIMRAGVDSGDPLVVEEERVVVLEVAAAAEGVILEVAGEIEVAEGVLIRETVLGDSRTVRPKIRRSPLMINKGLYIT